MFHYLYYSVTINEFKEKFYIVVCSFSAIKKIVASINASVSGDKNKIIIRFFSVFYWLIKKMVYCKLMH